MKKYDVTNASFVTDLTELNKKNQPGMILKDHSVNKYFNISDIVKKKQTINITKDSFDELFKIMPRYARSALRSNQIDEYYTYNSLEEFMDKENVRLDDGYNMLEYNGTYDFLFVAGNFFYYLKKYNPESISINLYNITNSNIPQFLKSYAVDEPENIPELDYTKDLDSFSVQYSMLSSQKYDIINCQGVDVPCLFTNLPYEYYNKIEDLDYLAYYDFQKKDFYFTGTPYQDLISTMNDIAKHGIYNPLYLKINNGNIVCTLESHDKLIIAKMLKLPYIPVCLYLTPLQTAPYEFLFDRKPQDNSLINSICNPYFSFK